MSDEREPLVEVAGAPGDDERRVLERAVAAATEERRDERAASGWWREGMADAVRETPRRPAP